MPPSGRSGKRRPRTDRRAPGTLLSTGMRGPSDPHRLRFASSRDRQQPSPWQTPGCRPRRERNDGPEAQGATRQPDNWHSILRDMRRRSGRRQHQLRRTRPATAIQPVDRADPSGRRSASAVISTSPAARSRCWRSEASGRPGASRSLKSSSEVVRKWP